MFHQYYLRYLFFGFETFMKEISPSYLGHKEMICWGSFDQDLLVFVVFLVCFLLCVVRREEKEALHSQMKQFIFLKEES